jgi:hypothetical protein
VKTCIDVRLEKLFIKTGKYMVNRPHIEEWEAMAEDKKREFKTDEL